MTNIKGLFAAGNMSFFFQHGGNRLGANSLLSAIYGGTVAGPNAIDYISNIDRSYTDMDEVFLKNVKLKSKNVLINYLAMRGTENAYKLHREPKL